MKGDELLISVAKCLTSSLRKTDIIARLGGDEFAIIVENANDTALAIIENRINLALANNAQLNKYQLGCSIGSTFMNRADNELSFFERADEILYRRKMQVSAHLSVV